VAAEVALELDEHGGSPIMTTKLTGALKRELEIDGQPYTLTIMPKGLRLAPKGKRTGYELGWKALLSGEAALAAALSASLADDGSAADR
jgi:hypothetical protein